MTRLPRPEVTGLRIVLVTHYFPAHAGGVEGVAAQLAARMAAAGHAVTWCASDCDPPPDLPGVQGLPLRAFNVIERASGFPYPLWSPGALRELAATIRVADAVHVHDGIYACSLAAARLARRHGKPLVVTQHIGVVPLPPLLAPLLAAANRLAAAQVLRHARGVAFVSPVVRRHFEGLGVPAVLCHDVPNGVDHALFRRDGATAASRIAALELDPARPLLLFVGRFVAKKRLGIVREMARARPDWQWVVIGRGTERPQDWGLANVRVLAPMAQAELAAWYRTADLLVLPSVGEGFPLVVQEAMACGLPACITADVAAGAVLAPELWLELPECATPSATAAGGVAAIDGWLARPASAREARRAACADHARAAWDWDHAARRHLAWMAPAAA